MTMKDAEYCAFESDERDLADGPLAHGIFVNCSRVISTAQSDDSSDVGQLQNVLIADALRRRRAEPKLASFPPPYLLMDLCDAVDIGLQMPSDSLPKGMLRMLIPAAFIVELGTISSDRIGGMSVVKCNAAVPVYRWFLAANLLLEHHKELGRVVPFPLDQPATGADDEGGAQPAMTTFQFLRVTQAEHAEYKKLLDFAVSSEGLGRGFGTAARFSYEILRKRGVATTTDNKRLEHSEVDRLITRVILKNPSALDCVLFAGLEEDPSADADLLTRHAVLRC